MSAAHQPPTARGPNRRPPTPSSACGARPCRAALRVTAPAPADHPCIQGPTPPARTDFTQTPSAVDSPPSLIETTRDSATAASADNCIAEGSRRTPPGARSFYRSSKASVSAAGTLAPVRPRGRSAGHRRAAGRSGRCFDDEAVAGATLEASVAAALQESARARPGLQGAVTPGSTRSCRSCCGRSLTSSVSRGSCGHARLGASGSWRIEFIRQRAAVAAVRGPCGEPPLRWPARRHVCADMALGLSGESLAPMGRCRAVP
jgi:hypothetical protein